MPSARRADFIEDLFTGAIAAIYNYFASAAFLLLSPVRASLRLTVRRRLPTLSQLAPHTIIVLTLVVGQLTKFQTSTLIPHMEQLVVDRSVPVPVTYAFAAGVAMVIALDLASRLVARVVHWRSRRKRLRLLTPLMYAYAAYVLYTIIGDTIVDCVTRFSADSIFVPRADRVAADIASGFVWVVATLPVVYVVARSSLAVPTRAHKRIYVALRYVGLFLLVAPSIIAALLVHDRANELLQDRTQISATYCSCTIASDGSATAVLVFNNVGHNLVALQPQDFWINVDDETGHRLAAGRIDAVDGSTGAGRPIYLIAPTSASWLKLTSPPRRDMVLAFSALANTVGGNYCTVHVLNDQIPSARGPLTLQRP